MIWHIVKKDLRLMWPFVALLTTLAAMQCGLEISAGTVVPAGPMVVLLQLLPLIVWLSIAVVTVIVVQQDNLVGDRHDWLLRPIPAHSVLAAKVLFVILAVHAPLFLIDVLQIAATGISVRQALIPALSHQFVLFFLATTPALIVGATTRNVVAAVGFSVGVFVLFTLILFGVNFGVVRNPAVSPIQSGYSWVVAWTTFLLYVAIIFFLARFQYRERRETPSRIVGVIVTVAAFALLCWFPWGAAIKAQQWIDGAPVGEEAISLSFPAGSSLQSLPPQTMTGGRNGVLAPFRPGRDLNILDLVSGIHQVTLPVQIAGLPTGDVMTSDRGTFRIESATGISLFDANGPICARLDRGGVSGTNCQFAILRGHGAPTDAGVARGEIQLPLPTAVYKQIKNQPVRIIVDFTLTWLRHNGSQFLHAVNDKKMLAGIGLCTSGVDREGDDIELRCVTAVRQPTCIGATLADVRTGARNPLLFGCRLDYAPLPANWLPPAVLKRSGADLPFLDLDGLAHYPVDGSQIGEAEVVIDTFVPRAHLNRSVEIPSIRLSDWETRSPKPVL
ncbi:MAG TPA: hypothetical protein VGV09_09810 [Steroidobacteraceae bacterium]|nr:hypothetical protein [Steroidobacteraceae bacterium]